MSFGAWPSLDYEWRASVPPSDLAARLQALIRDEHRICGDVGPTGFRIRLGRTPTGFRRSTYEAIVEADGDGSRIRATVVPRLGVNVPRFTLWAGIAIGGILLASGAGHLVLSGNTAEAGLMAAIGAGWLILSVVFFYGHRAAHWLDAEEIQAYLLERFRDPVVAPFRKPRETRM